MSAALSKGKGWTLKWFGGELQADVRATFNQRLDEVGMYLEDKIRENISVPAPPHSDKGEFPRLVKGVLQAATDYYRDAGAMKVVVYNTAPYAMYLETTAGRSFMRRTMIEELARIKAIMTRSGLVKRSQFAIV